MTDLCTQISEVTRSLPPALQSEVLDFAWFVKSRRGSVELAPGSDWVDQVWGALPDFPDRAPQGELSNFAGLD